MALKGLIVDAAGTGGFIYGAQQVILAVVEQTAGEVEWTAAVATGSGPYPERLKQLGVAVKVLPLRGPLPLARRAIAGLLREGFDFVHTHDLRASAAARLPAYRAGVPIVTSFHEDLRQPHLGALARWKRQLMVRVEQQTADLPVVVLAVSQPIGEEASSLLGIDPVRIEVVPNGVNVGALRASATPEQVAEARQETGLEPADRPVVLVGKLTRRKGQHLLLQAAPEVLQQHPETVFILVGEGPDRAALEQQAQSLGVSERCRFVGFQNPSAPWLAMSCLAVLPSLAEGTPIVALEAMALGKPLVASAVGGTPDLVLDGETGVLVPSESVDALAAALIRLLDDPIERARLGHAAAERIERSFTVQHLAQRHLVAYRRAVGRVG